MTAHEIVLLGQRQLSECYESFLKCIAWFAQKKKKKKYIVAAVAALAEKLKLSLRYDVQFDWK